MKVIGMSFLLVLAVLLEGTITTVPCVWIILLAWAIMQRNELIFFLGFFAGIILDTFTFHPVGESSMLFTFFLFLVLLYERKYETDSLPFMLIASFIGGLVFMWVMGNANLLSEAILSMFLGGFIFIITNSRKNSQQSSYPLRGILRNK